MSSKLKSYDVQLRPNTVPWPPIILMLAVIIGWMLGRWLPTLVEVPFVGHFLIGKAQVWLGWLLVTMAVSIDVWVLIIFRRHNTNIRPDKPAEVLVTSGPFAYSRNPIYVGNVVIIVGLAIAKGSLWYLLLVPVVFLLIEKLAIKREEAHIAARFNSQWTEYAAKVRRWL